MAVIQFSGKLDAGWTRAIQPKGSRLIAYIAGKDRFNPDLPAYTAVFQNLKKPRKLTMFETVNGQEPEERKPDRPIAAFRHLIERSRGEIDFIAPKDEVMALLSEASLTREESEKKREVSRLQGRLEAIAEELENIENWKKHEEITETGARHRLIYSLSTIAWLCNVMIANVSADLCNGSAEETETPEAAEM